MRNFLIASASSMKTGAIENLSDLTNGQLAFAVSGGNTKIVGLNASVQADQNVLAANKRYQLLLGDVDVDGQMRHLVIPIYAHHMSYSHMTYKAATTFSAEITVTEPNACGPYTVIIAKKGVPFNERNKWTSDVYVRNCESTAAADVAEKLVESINLNTESHGVVASIKSQTTDTIVVTATKPGVDYEVLVADCLMECGASVSVVSAGIPAEADKAMVIDLANKAVADTGVNDTYAEAGEYMHPRYPITRGAASLAEKYDILTIRFAEPREMKTRDDIVHQIVQIAFPQVSNAANPQLTALKAILDKLV